jgi:hydroxymethylpyrimidine pyrophosphatase-like HAD family hydrolase
MRFNVLALDYDGTIARDGRAHPAVLEAIMEARARQIVIVLVTGRIMSDLRRVLAEQGLFDAIVAENGAVLAFPRGRTRLLGRGREKESSFTAWKSTSGPAENSKKQSEQE